MAGAVVRDDWLFRKAKNKMGGGVFIRNYFYY